MPHAAHALTDQLVLTAGEAMVVAQGLALATTEAAGLLFQSGRSLWQAWQASADPAAPLMSRMALTSPKSAMATSAESWAQLQPDWEPSVQQDPGHRFAANSASLGPEQRFSAARHALHGMLSRVKATAQLAFQTLEPLRDIILLLPLGVLVVGGLAAAWSRKGMPLPRPRALLAIAMATLTSKPPPSSSPCKCMQQAPRIYASHNLPCGRAGGCCSDKHAMDTCLVFVDWCLLFVEEV